MPVALLRENNQVIGAELLAPHPLSRLGFIPHEGAAACLSLSGDDILTENNAPQVLSVGLPFLVAERASRNALARVVPNRAGFDRVLPVDGARSVYAYTRAAPDDSVDIYARAFSPRLCEDPATGSATAATAALLAEISKSAERELRFRFVQGWKWGDTACWTPGFAKRRVARSRSMSAAAV